MSKRDDLVKKADEHVESKRQEFVKSFDSARDFKHFLELLPDDVIELKDDEPGHFWANWNLDGGTLTIPYDLVRFKAIKEALEAKGWKASHQNKTNTDIWEYFTHEDARFMRLSIDLDAKKPGAKCILVPIEWETKTVVKTVDYVCPDGHPELFEAQEDGSLKYKGDELFPAPPEGVKV